MGITEILLAIISFLLTAIGLGFAYISNVQNEKTRKIKLSETINEFSNRLYSSKDLWKFFSLVVQDDIGTEINFGNVNSEHNEFVLRGLDFMNSVCLFIRSGIIAPEDLSGTSVGFLIFESAKCKALQDFIEKIDESDTEVGFNSGKAFRFYREQLQTFAAAE